MLLIFSKKQLSISVILCVCVFYILLCFYFTNFIPEMVYFLPFTHFGSDFFLFSTFF